MRDPIAPLAAKGFSADEVAANASMKDLDEKWGGGFLKGDVFVRCVHPALTRKQ